VLAVAALAAAVALGRRAQDALLGAAIGAGPAWWAARRSHARTRVALRQLEQAHAELLAARPLESIGRLAAGVAHEINTPIQYVGDNIGFLTGAFSDLIVALDVARAEHLVDACGTAAGVPASPGSAPMAAGPTDDDIDFLRGEVPQALQQSATGVARVAEIVLALKGAAHPGDGVSAVELNQLVSETTVVARGEWKRVAQLELELDPALPVIEGRRGELGQVLLNLVVNAAHAVAARREHEEGFVGRIRIATRAEGASVVVTVDDNGDGVTPDVAARVFEPFFTTKAAGQGTGQGLAIVATIVRDHHGGSIELRRSELGGASFVIHLPVRSVDPAPRASAR
jgi:C4-dicarboxylate-specific signal transduction histidine kinase